MRPPLSGGLRLFGGQYYFEGLVAVELMSPPGVWAELFMVVVFLLARAARLAALAEARLALAMARCSAVLAVVPLGMTTSFGLLVPAIPVVPGVIGLAPFMPGAALREGAPPVGDGLTLSLGLVVPGVCVALLATGFPELLLASAPARADGVPGTVPGAVVASLGLVDPGGLPVLFWAGVWA